MDGLKAPESGARLRNVLQQAVALSTSEFSSKAAVLGALTSKWLSEQAARVLQRAEDANSANSTLSRSTHLAVLAAIHRLSELQKGIPIDLTTLHDFIIVYTAPSNELVTQKESRLARRVLETLLRKKPSLARAIETQLIPGWTEMLQAFAASVDVEHWLAQAQAVIRSMTILSSVSRVRDALRTSSSALAFWTAFQSFYDIYLPQLCAANLPADFTSVTQLPHFTPFVKFRKDLVDFYVPHFPHFSATILSEAIENEASSPEPPKALSDLAITALVNMTLLQDAEYYHHISRLVGSKQVGDGSTYSQEEKAYFQAALDFTKTIAREDIVDSLTVSSKGKGKATASDMDDAREKLSSMVNAVLSVLPESSVQDVRRLLTSAALEQVADDAKVERVISMLLEGDVPPIDAMSAEPPRPEDPTPVSQRSRFASARSNIFTESLDVSRLHRGKQDLATDSFLPAELRASILAAAQRQAEESDEEEEERRRMEEEERLADADVDDDTPAVVKVKDDVSEESGTEDGDQPIVPSATASSKATSATHSIPGQVPSLSSTGVPRELEKVYMSSYTKDTSVFAREQRKSAARLDLKKKIAALHLPDSISDEQIEGWARMLERNPRKDKLLERFGEQQWHGNEKGQSVQPGASEQKSNKERGNATNAQSPVASDSQDASGGRGRGRGQGGRGRGGKGNRGHQSDARRRGHDKKMQKTGV